MKKTRIEKGKSLRELKKKLWRVFSKFIRGRDGYICYTCGKDLITTPKLADAGHYVPRSKGNALYFDERNVHCQCVNCNRHRHGNLAIYALKLEAQYGQGILQELFLMREQIWKPTHEWYEEKIAYYTRRVNEWKVPNAL